MSDTLQRRGPKRTGSIEAQKRAGGVTVYYARVRLADGTRERIRVPEKHIHPAGGMSGEERRELFAMSRQEHEDETGELLAKRRERQAREKAEHEITHGETWTLWFARYLKTKECGEGHRQKSAAVGNKWITSVIGAKPMVALTRDDIEDVRDKLDAAIDAKTIRHATARNAWAVLTSALKAAVGARDRSLRVLAVPLHFGILPPKRGVVRKRTWVYPREWDALVSCKLVPVAWKQLCALALYTGLRPGELEALLWTDVDLEAMTISVSKAVDPAVKGKKKTPKSIAGQRIIPILPPLLPLLTALHKRAKKARNTRGPVVDFISISDDHAAERFRASLKAAGANRPRLTADNETEEPVDFRSLRDTHATWLALEGVSPQIIQRRMGHSSLSTTDRYVKAAETFAVDNVGRPFGELPSEVLETGPQLGHRLRRPPNFSGDLVARVGFE
ncbi:MAG TPA: site-specific integrase, partial [Polyangiaceae bacterium]